MIVALPGLFSYLFYIMSVMRGWRMNVGMYIIYIKVHFYLILLKVIWDIKIY